MLSGGCIWTALHHAVRSDLGLAVKMLLDKHASVATRNAAGQTPLDVARAALDDRSLARHLLEEDAQLQQLARMTRLPKQWLEDNVFKLSFLVPWLVLPAFAWILLTTDGVAFIFLKEAILLTTAFGALKVLQRGTYGDKRKAAALMLGINVASVFWLVVCFPGLARDAGVGVGFQLAIYTSAALILVFLYLTAVTDAGTVFTTYREKIHVRHVPVAPPGIPTSSP
jgi:palmitoyltransferase ZDHHC13/17